MVERTVARRGSGRASGWDARRHALRAATHGRLVLASNEGIARELDGATLMGSHVVDGTADLEPGRDLVRMAALEAGLPIEKTRNAALCAGEALSNALLHGGAARLDVFARGDRIAIRVSDCGPGIPQERLPAATLITGYSTRPQSLGAGFTIMRELADRMWLSTGPAGTVVLLELSGARTPPAAEPQPPLEHVAEY